MGIATGATFLVDGNGTTVDFGSNPNLWLHEVTLQPPGTSGGGKINTTGMRNTAVRTARPKKLADVTPSKGTGKYNPKFLEDYYAMRRTNQQITITHPDGSKTIGWGWLEEVIPSENSDGEQPMVDFVIEWSNENSSGVETRPYVSGV